MIVYTVQSGDTLWRIAKRYAISLDALIASNPHISDPNYILPGQQINVPELWRPVEPVPPGTPEPPQNESADASAGMIHRYSAVSPGQISNTPTCNANGSVRPCIYTAQDGESLADIGHRFMVPLSRLAYYNLRHGKNEPLSAGTRIVIPEAEPCPNQPSPSPRKRQRGFRF